MADLFASPLQLLAGAGTGILFGALLQRARVTRHTTIVNQFLLRDFTVLKVMLTAILVSAIGLQLLPALGVDLPSKIKSANLLAVGLGAVLFGGGMVLLGYCPGTGMAALGDGARDAWAGLAGMLVGAGLYAAAQPHLPPALFAQWSFGKVSLSEITGWPPLLFLCLLALAWLAAFLRLRPRTVEGHGSTTAREDVG